MRSLLKPVELKPSAPKSESDPAPGGPKRQRYRRGDFLAIVLIVLLIAIGTSAGLAYQRGKALETRIGSMLGAAQGDLEAGKMDLKTASANRDVTRLATARAHFAAATARFRQASDTARGSSFLKLGVATPGVNTYVGPRAHAVQLVAGLGMALSDAATRAADIDELLLAPSSAGEEGSSKLVGVLKLTDPALKFIKADLLKASRDAAGVDISVLPTSQRAAFSKAKSGIAKGISGVDEFTTLIPVLFEILGVNGPRAYLIEQLNPAELRPGGGFIGTYSVMDANQGSLKLAKTGDIKTLDFPRPIAAAPGFVSPPAPLRQLIGASGWSLEDSNFAPDFQANAQAAETFASRSLGTRIDGVLAIDFYAVANLLKLTGPLAVPSENFTVTAENLVPEIIRRDEIDSNHKEFLAQIAAPLLTRVASLPANRWPDLVTSLNELAVSRHLQAFFNSQSAQEEMGRIGWSGSLNPGGARDFMMAVETNLSATKANYWLEREYDVTLTRVGDSLHHEVKIHLTNRTPIGFLGAYVCYFRYYLPSDAASDKVTGLRPNLETYTESRKSIRFVDGWIDLPNPNSRIPSPEWNLSIAYDTRWTPDAAGQARIYWQKQAGTSADKVAVAWNDAGRNYRVLGDLTQDRVIRLGPAGVALESGQAATAHLPNLSL